MNSCSRQNVLLTASTSSVPRHELQNAFPRQLRKSPKRRNELTKWRQNLVLTSSQFEIWLIVQCKKKFPNSAQFLRQAKQSSLPERDPNAMVKSEPTLKIGTNADGMQARMAAPQQCQWPNKRDNDDRDSEDVRV